MQASDREEFIKLMGSMANCFHKEPLAVDAIMLYFAALSNYSIEQVRWALNKHLVVSKFFPRVADLTEHIEGGSLTADEVIAHARNKKTPLGILCRIKIGSFDLENQTDMFYLKQRAQECIALIPEWKRKAAEGDYSDHEISIMIKHDVDPCQPFYDGLPNPNVEKLKLRISSVTKSKQHQFLLEPPHQPGWHFVDSVDKTMDRLADIKNDAYQGENAYELEIPREAG